MSHWIQTSIKVWTLSWKKFLSLRNQYIGSFYKSKDLILYIRDLHHEIFKTVLIHIHRESVLTCCKAKFAFLVCFSIWIFFHEYSQFTGQQVKREAASLYSFYHFQPLHRHCDISWVVAAESLTLCIASSGDRT